MEKLGAVIIGPGWVAEEHIKGYVQDPRTEVRSIVGFIDRAVQCQVTEADHQALLAGPMIQKQIPLSRLLAGRLA